MICLQNGSKKYSGKDEVVLVIVKELGLLTLLLTGGMFRGSVWNRLHLPLASAEDDISPYVQESALIFCKTESNFQLYHCLPGNVCDKEENSLCSENFGCLQCT